MDSNILVIITIIIISILMKKLRNDEKLASHCLFYLVLLCLSRPKYTLYKLIQIVLHQPTQLLFHVTVFNLNSLDTDYSLRTNHKWKWELVRSRRHPDGRSQSRVILVLALPPPDRAGPVDMDILDCLQQEAKMSICSGPIMLPHCARSASDKVDRVWSRCAGDQSQVGVSVICWGCGVWHRYTIIIPTFSQLSSAFRK